MSRLATSSLVLIALALALAGHGRGDGARGTDAERWQPAHDGLCEAAADACHIEPAHSGLGSAWDAEPELSAVRRHHHHRAASISRRSGRVQATVPRLAGACATTPTGPFPPAVPARAFAATTYPRRL